MFKQPTRVKIKLRLVFFSVLPSKGVEMGKVLCSSAITKEDDDNNDNNAILLLLLLLVLLLLVGCLSLSECKKRLYMINLHIVSLENL